MAKTAKPPSDKAEQSDGAAAAPKRSQWTVVDYCATALVILIGLGILRWLSLAEGSRYFLPFSADDWVAWGTWAGATGAVLAVVYAARSVRQALAAQASQEHQREEDRVSREAAAARAEQKRADDRAAAIVERDEAWDRERVERDVAWNRERQEREKERDKEVIRRADEAKKEALRRADEAVREATARQDERDRDTNLRRTERDDDLTERRKIQENLDELARANASKLTWNIHTGRPLDSQYAEVYVQLHAPASHNQPDSASPQTSGEETTELFVVIANTSKETSFTELSLHLLEPGLNAQVTAIEYREIPPSGSSDSLFPGKPPVWVPVSMDRYAPIYPPELNQWALSCPRQGRELLVTLTFDSLQERLHWMWERHQGEDIDAPSGGHLIMAFTDPGKRSWIRSTHAAIDRPFRVWEPGI